MILEKTEHLFSTGFYIVKQSSMDSIGKTIDNFNNKKYHYKINNLFTKKNTMKIYNNGNRYYL